MLRVDASSDAPPPTEPVSYSLKKEPSVNLDPGFLKKKHGKSEGVGDIGNRILITHKNHRKIFF